MDQKLLSKIKELALQDAKERRTNAAYGGSWGDGGASEIENQVRFYEYGQQGTLPAEWKKFQAKAEKVLQQQSQAQDPDWETYLRLKNKFE